MGLCCLVHRVQDLKLDDEVRAPYYSSSIRHQVHRKTVWFPHNRIRRDGSSSGIAHMKGVVHRTKCINK